MAPLVTSLGIRPGQTDRLGRQGAELSVQNTAGDNTYSCNNFAQVHAPTSCKTHVSRVVLLHQLSFSLWPQLLAPSHYRKRHFSLKLYHFTLSRPRFKIAPRFTQHCTNHHPTDSVLVKNAMSRNHKAFCKHYNINNKYMESHNRLLVVYDDSSQ